MAENKQYITQEQANGKVMISEDVITTIITQAVSEVEGVAGLTENKKTRKTIKVTISEEENVSIDCTILVNYGSSVVEVASNLQNVVTTAVESTTGVKVTAVNVNVCGIVRK